MVDVRAGVNVELVYKRGVPVAQRFESCFELGEPGLQTAGVEVAVFERLVVAVECALAAADLLAHRVSLFFERRPVVAAVTAGGRECGGDQVAVTVEADELVEHGGFELVAVEPVPVAAFRSELLPARAGVVVVDASVAARAHPDVGALAAAAAHHPGEQEIGAVAAPP